MCHTLKTYSLFISFTYAYGIILGVQIKIDLRYQFLNLLFEIDKNFILKYHTLITGIIHAPCTICAVVL